MDSFLFTLISFIVALGVLITVHEFGHFWVARKMGVQVLRFSVGFGKPIWRRKGRDDTEYQIAMIPLGGYVKMLDEREGLVEDKDLSRAFNRKPLSARAAIVAAGPIFNLLFAIIAFWLVFVIGDTGTRPLVGGVVEDSVAYQGGFQPGDEWLAVGDRTTPSWETAVYTLLSASMDTNNLQITVKDRDGMERIRSLPGKGLAERAEDGRLLESLGLSPERPRIPAVIGTVVDGEAAALAGLQTGDLVLALDNQPVEDWSALVKLIQKRPGAAVSLALEREGQIQTVPVIIGRIERGGKQQGRIGAGVQVPEGLYERYKATFQLSPLEAIPASFEKTWDMSFFMLKMMGRMLTGEASIKNLSGPISIAQIAGKTASYGAIYFLKFLALISVSLGILNLLPVPILDGGHLMFYLVEAIMGRPLSEEIQIQGQKVGMAILLALMGLAFYVDLTRLLG
ncbi:MAG: RIP metalloprotease RseP [Gammaproteobacteria bacterium]|nr:RIP metalloprotease RseP [Gammaproteobacteria bacterium]